jgi:malate permease and related proteins
MFADLFTIIAPVLITAGIGFGWGRFGRDFDVEFVTALVTVVGAPCLIFHTLANLSVGTDEFLTMVGAAIVVMSLSAGIGTIVLRAARLPMTAFLPSLVFANTGNMGLPLSSLAFGETGLALAIGIFALSAVLQFTVGVAISSGRLSFGMLARVPLLYALPPALIFMFSGAKPPAWLNATTELIGLMTIPLMLITLGVSLARLTVASLPRSLGLSLLRLSLGFALGVGAAYLFRLDGAARGVLIVQSSMPVAVFNYLFAQRYRRQPEEVAGLVVISTVLSFLTLPLLLLYVL